MGILGHHGLLMGGGVYTPEKTYASVGGAWHYGWDNTDLKVNSDGTGGSVANGGTIGRWNDRSGNGNFVSQVTANLRPIFRTGKGVNFFWATNTTTRQAFLYNLAIGGIPRANCSGGFVADIDGPSASAIIDLGLSEIVFNAGAATAVDNRFMRYFNGAAHVSTGLQLSSRKLVCVFRSNGTNFTVRVNGAEYSLGAALGAVTMTRLHMARFNGGSPKPLRIYESVIFNEDAGETTITNLEDYFRNQIGSYLSTHTVVFIGDSLTQGVGSETYTPFAESITNRLTSKWISLASDGAYLYIPKVSAATAATLKGSVEGVYIIWLGTNDINSGAKTGLQTAASMKAYSDTLRAAGGKVIVCNLQQLPTNDIEATAFNAQLIVDSASYDAIVDLRSAFPDYTNATYFTSDTIHMTDAAYVLIAGLLDTAMAGV